MSTNVGGKQNSAKNVCRKICCKILRKSQVRCKHFKKHDADSAEMSFLSNLHWIANLTSHFHFFLTTFLLHCILHRTYMCSVAPPWTNCKMQCTIECHHHLDVTPLTLVVDITEMSQQTFFNDFVHFLNLLHLGLHLQNAFLGLANKIHTQLLQPGWWARRRLIGWLCQKSSILGTKMLWHFCQKVFRMRKANSRTPIKKQESDIKKPYNRKRFAAFELKSTAYSNLLCDTFISSKIWY